MAPHHRLKYLFPFALLYLCLYYACATGPGAEQDYRGVVRTAESLVNSPYRYGGSDNRGFDCSGLTRYVYNQATGIGLSRSANAQFRKGRKLKRSQVRPGDLVFFGRKGHASHVGLVQKVNRKGIWMIHASSSRGVISENVDASDYWSTHLLGFRRYI